jgi:hypothetical protein
MNHTVGSSLPGLTSEQVRLTIEAILQAEKQIPSGNSRWSEMRMVRRVLGRLLVAKQEEEERMHLDAGSP